MENLKIEYLPIAELKPYECNANKHDEKSVEVIKNSIEKFGMCDPLGIWGEDNVICEGHGRLLALKQLGYKEVPCIRLDHLTDEERRAYVLAHNQTHKFSDWDIDILNEELEDISFDMEQFGFLEEVEEEIEKVIALDVEFTEVLGEEHNYIVLYFDNEVDWLQAESLFDIHTVKALSTRKDGKLTKSMERKGVGRVLNGAKALQKIMGDKL